MASINLTESRIWKLKLGSGIWRHQQVKGLMVICHSTTKTYSVQGDVCRSGRHVRTARIKIDRVNRISLKDARNRTRELMSQIQSGVDPTAKLKESTVTIAKALDVHLGERPFREATATSQRYHVGHYLTSHRNRPTANLSRPMARDICAKLRTVCGQTATGVMRTLHAIINTAMRMGITITENPICALRLPMPPNRQVEALDLAEWRELTEELHRSGATFTAP